MQFTTLTLLTIGLGNNHPLTGSTQRSVAMLCQDWTSEHNEDAPYLCRTALVAGPEATSNITTCARHRAETLALEFV